MKVFKGKMIDWRITLVIGLVCSLYIWRTLILFNESNERLRVRRSVDQVQSALKTKLNAYQVALRSGVALFASSKSVERDEWHTFVQALQTDHRLVGVLGFGYIESVRPDDLANFIESTRADGYPDFRRKVVPGGDIDDPYQKFVIKYIEPVSRNAQALGLDVATERKRRTAAEKARDYNLETVTGVIQLVQSGEGVSGALLYAAVYRNNTKSNTIDERRANHLGWVYAPIVFRDVFRGSFETPEKDLIYTIEGVDKNLYPEQLFQSNSSDQFEDNPLGESFFDFADQKFCLKYFHGPGYFSKELMLNHLLGFFSLSFVVGLSLFIRVLANREEVARKLALQMTASRDREREKMVHTSRLSDLGRIAASTAHEINNPLAILHLNTRKIRRVWQSKAADPQTVQNAFDSIDSCITRITAIVRGLKTFAREDDESLRVPTSLDSLFQTAFDLTSYSLKNKGVLLEITPIPPNIILNCNPVQISQVLVNLIHNAADAIFDLQKKWIKIEIEKRLNLIVIAITDSGSGITPEIYAQMWEPFFTTKERGVGTGLGLSIVKSIIENHSGVVELDTESFHTKFLIHLPVMDAKDMAEKKGIQVV